MIRSCFILLLLFMVNLAAKSQPAIPGYQLVWADEFDKDGLPNPANWTYEKGFVRNHELQYYQPENARCENGMLVIEARKESKPNPAYQADSKDWRKSRPTIEYTSACLLSKGLQSWQFGLYEIRARIDTRAGLWPAWWTLGVSQPWPANGEIDMMEYYRGKLLANIACLGENKKTEWHSNTFPVDSMGGSKWASEFHVWTMDWNEQYIALYVDNQLLNKVSISQLVNKDGSGFNPFLQPHYMLFDLALGGDNGGDLGNTSFPNRMEVDYVRVYAKKQE